MAALQVFTPSQTVVDELEALMRMLFADTMCGFGDSKVPATTFTTYTRTDLWCRRLPVRSLLNYEVLSRRAGTSLRRARCCRSVCPSVRPAVVYISGSLTSLLPLSLSLSLSLSVSLSLSLSHSILSLLSLAAGEVLEHGGGPGAVLVRAPRPLVRHTPHRHVCRRHVYTHGTLRSIFAPYLAREHHRNILSLDKKRQRAFVHPVKIHVPIGTVIDGVISSSFVARHQQSIQRDTDESQYVPEAEAVDADCQP